MRRLSLPQTLRLANGTLWAITGQDGPGRALVAKLSKTMGLRQRARLDGARVALVSSTPQARGAGRAYDDTTATCALQQVTIAARSGRGRVAHRRLLAVPLLICREAEATSGLLVHAALASYRGRGVLFAGPSGAGKSTTSGRLPTTWLSHCDDATLVVRDASGRYIAHAWPTWSRVLAGDRTAAWDVERAVPLAAICFLVRAPEDDLEPVGAGQTACLLAAVTEQASAPRTWNATREEIRAQRQQRFDNACALAQTIPGYLLRLGPDGPFWRRLERLLTGRSPRRRGRR